MEYDFRYQHRFVDDREIERFEIVGPRHGKRIFGRKGQDVPDYLLIVDLFLEAIEICFFDLDVGAGRLPERVEKRDTLGVLNIAPPASNIQGSSCPSRGSV